MKKSQIILSLCIFLLCASPLFAQELILQGVVIDAKTQQTIPEASILIEGGNVGISTNADGQFLLRVPATLKQNNLMVAFLGYETYKINIAQISNPQSIQIFLKESADVLHEVSVGAITPAQIVEKAYNKIPENYALTNTVYTGFYRESNYHYQNPLLQKCYYIIEAVTKINKPSYKTTYPQGEVKLIEVRKKQFVSDSLKFSKWVAGAFTPMRFDVAKKRFEFIKPAHLDRYKYEIQDFTTYYDREVYKIRFTPAKSSADYQGTLYIDTETFAIVKADYQYSEKGLNRENISRGGHTELSERIFRINYQPLGNKWYIQSIWQQAKAYDDKAKDSVRYKTEYAVTRLDTNQREKFEYGDQIQWDEVFLLKNDAYSADFWKDYTIVVPTEAESNLLIEKQTKITPTTLESNKDTSTVAQINNKTDKYRKKRRFSNLIYTLASPYFVQVAASNLSLAYNDGKGFEFQENLSFNPIQLANSFGLGAEYRIYRNITASYQGFVGFGRFKAIGIEAGLQGRILLSSPKKRPLYLTWGAHYMNLAVLRTIKIIDNPADKRLVVNETTFERKTVRMDVGKQQDIIKGALGIEVDFNHATSFFANVGYFVPLSMREGIYFQDRGFVFARKQRRWIDANDSKLTIQADGSRLTSVPFKTNFTVQIGIRGTLKFRW